MERTRKVRLIHKLKVYFALPPFNELTNYSAGDNFYWKSIELEFTKEEIAECRKELGV